MNHGTEQYGEIGNTEFVVNDRFFSNVRLLYQLVFRKIMVVEMHIIHDVFGYTLSKQRGQRSDFRIKKLHNKFKLIQQFVRIAGYITLQ
jgi:hypothetical protein